MPLPLYIFEPRYQEMIARCLHNKETFVVALIREGAEALGPLAEPYTVGCSAVIRDVTPVGDGRLHIKTMGVDRVRLAEVQSELAYLTCTTETFPLSIEGGPELEEQASRIRNLIARYVGILAPNGNRDLPNLPALHPVKLFWLAADLLQVRNARKQQFLEAPDARSLAESLEVAFRNEITLLTAIASQKQANADGNPLSLN